MQPDIVHLNNRALSVEENKILLQQCLVGRIATVNHEGIPYITPVNYAYELETDRIYIHHSSGGGQLLTNLQNSNQACFEVDQPGAIVKASPGTQACGGDQIYRSVICLGRITIANDEEKIRGLRLLANKYMGKPILNPIGEFKPATLDRLVILAVDIGTTTGKCREPRNQSRQ